MAKNNNSASFIRPAQPALCNLAQSAFQDKSSVYLFTNENVAEYIPSLDLTGARVLTVCASGDHALMSYLSGASHVDTFDINSYQKNIYELKTHMIRNLDFGAFHDFFFSRYNFFSRDIIRPFYGDFSSDLHNFLQAFYQTRNLAMFKHFDYSCLPCISYLNNEDKYRQLAKVLPPEISFTHCDIGELSGRFSDRYNLIMLSNIFDYLYRDTNADQETRLMQYYSDVLSPLTTRNLVPQHGRIGVNYMWGAKPSVWTNFTHYLNRNILQPVVKNPDIGFTARGFLSSRPESTHDVVLWFHQNKLQH